MSTVAFQYICVFPVIILLIFNSIPKSDQNPYSIPLRQQIIGTCGWWPSDFLGNNTLFHIFTANKFVCVKNLLIHKVLLPELESQFRLWYCWRTLYEKNSYLLEELGDRPIYVCWYSICSYFHKLSDRRQSCLKQAFCWAKQWSF